MATTHTLATEVEFGGDAPTACFEVEIAYGVNWGRPAKTYGRPEDCYMGDPDEIGWAKVTKIEGKPRPWGHIHGGCCARGGNADDDLEQMILDHIGDDRLIEEAAGDH